MSDLFWKLWENGLIQMGIWETLYMTIGATAIAYLLGLPLGVLLTVTGADGIHPRPIFHRVLSIFVNIFRSIPFLILMVAMLPVADLIVGTSMGNAAMMVVLVIAAAPYIARMVESSLNEVPQGVLEAAQAMGTSNFQIITKVLLPEARPSLLVGGIISTVTVLGYSAMAGTIGGTGLGQIAISYGYQHYENDIIWICLILIVIIVQLIQELGMVLVRKVDKRSRK